MEQRLHSRVLANPQIKAQFRLGGQTFSELPLANLGTDGCCLRIPARSIGTLEESTRLEDLELLHEDLPRAAFGARVAWVGRRVDPDGGALETGIQFLEAPVDFTWELVHFIHTQMPARSPDLDALDGLP